jgi:hypothetical protein
LQGSIIYTDAFGYGYVLNGFLTLNVGRSRTRRGARGVEDIDGRQA